VSTLPPARLRIRHLTAAQTDGRTRVSVEVSIDGPVARVWAALSGRTVARSTPPGLRRLVEAAERDMAQG